MQTRSEWTQARTAGAAWFRSDKCVLARRLAAYAAAGVPLHLGLLTDYPEKPIGLRHARRDRAVGRLIDRLEEGHSLSDAMAATGRFFQPEDVAFVRAGEETGSLREALEGWHASLAARHRLLASGLGALAYPVAISVFATGTLAIVAIQILPTLATLCTETGIELPLVTRHVLGAARMAPDVLWIAVVACGVFMLQRRLPRLRRALSRGADVLPALGPMRLGLARQCALHVMASHLAAGRTAPAGLRAAAQVLPSLEQRQELVEAANRLEAGDDLVQGGRHRVFDAQTAWTVNQALRTRDPASSMSSLASRALRDQELALSRVLVLFEPVLILILAVLLGTCVVAAYQPLFLSARLVP